MKLTILASGVAAVYAAPTIEDTDFINHPNVVGALNDPDASWTAGFNDFFGNMTFGEAKKQLLGTQLMEDTSEVEFAPQEYYDAFGIANADIPTEFDATTNWAISPIRDQQQCGSCWAFSAVEVLTDRCMIDKKDFGVLSPEHLVACDKVDQGCQGGQLPAAWNFLTKTGVPTDKCQPYKSGTGTTGTCKETCDSGDYKLYKAEDATSFKGVENIQKEIMTNGPVQVAFKVYKSFMTYKTGVYEKHFWELLPEGGHAVKFVGWGTEGGKDYWLVANSWNTSWGLKGYFKIARGKDSCGIETMGPPYAGKCA